MDIDRSPATTITQVDATVQRLLTLRAEHGRTPAHPLLKQTLAQIDHAIEELQQRTGAPLALTVSASRVRQVYPPLWRWFLLRSRDTPAATRPAASTPLDGA